MKKFISKFRYYLALLIFVLTIANVTTTPKQLKPSEGVITTSAVSGEWSVETY